MSCLAPLYLSLSLSLSDLFNFSKCRSWARPEPGDINKYFSHILPTIIDTKGFSREAQLGERCLRCLSTTRGRWPGQFWSSWWSLQFKSRYKSEKRKLTTSNWSCHQIRDTDLVSEKLGRILSPLFQCELEIFPTNFPPNKDRADQ